MNLADLDAGFDASFSYENLGALVKACSRFYRGSIERAADLPEAYERRRQLAGWVENFHRDCGTLTVQVEDAIGKLKDEPCVFLMAAHQPNLFAYNGVLRKATLNYVLAQKLSESLKLPVVSFFGIADQDFTDDRWVKSALLPDIERREGALQLRFDLPEKMMLNRVARPSEQALGDLRDKIANWIRRKSASVDRFCKSLDVEFSPGEVRLTENFEAFWSLVKDAHAKAKTYSDFNAFVMSRVVNVAWGYDTLFSRFSECQQIFEREFCFLLSHFDEYSDYVKEATSSENTLGGVYEQEYQTVPFWYHCDCGSKARLVAEQEGESFSGRGECLYCGKEHKVYFSSKDKPEISKISPRISARSLTMPLVFFDGLKVCCYVGGVGGQAYLREAKYVAEHLGTLFPPVVIWRPMDVYVGVSQLDALMTYRKFSGTFDLTQHPVVVAQLKQKIAHVENEVKPLKWRKRSLSADAEVGDGKRIEDKRALSVKQSKVWKETGFSLLMKDLKLLENVSAVMGMFPCIIDCAVNVGLKQTSKQWIAFLKENGDLSSNVSLQTDFDGLLQSATP